ncbi:MULTISPECIES: hypothetical protein [Limnobacter]|jgi:hypothetical protein|uniref:Peptidase C39-like domain-containing protein n=1 Tax=Limnobacter profundi TaxID=2732163 RepID=A0ABX6N8T7_9BURK|nr:MULTISPECIES: hypothetical protein [unclassified Limnobacter]MAG79842.1 hypothetical protein [Sutterellaceae bacterium]PZO13633.1 MAG: hypothetical protein DCE87_12820 [Betaproteobacteria bacterium]MBT85152.1 hypothetical protein [Sutterellaceae bacterium]MDP3271711.1 hypothetical protein [Limnobacter sp.]PZO23374.1 MAG: hypothetical protein DCE89_10050 [Betaproteobacteria bacterium]|tara:strand:- start:12196 stop:12831 length:636 start_codon:yes stop_codon:yes gene_type:complete
MSGNTNFGLDFSEAKSIVSTGKPLEFTTNPKFDLSTLYAFTAPEGVQRASGPCALGTILHHHEIGWNHLPKDRHGHPLNDPYIHEIMRWAECPDLLGGSMGTSPATMLKGLKKAGLVANWYAGNKPQATLNLIRSELFEGRPVIVLINHGPEGEPLLLEWEVVFNIENDTVSSKQTSMAQRHKKRSIAEFTAQMAMNLQQLSCSVITARKD